MIGGMKKQLQNPYLRKKLLMNNHTSSSPVPNPSQNSVDVKSCSSKTNKPQCVQHEVSKDTQSRNPLAVMNSISLIPEEKGTKETKQKEGVTSPKQKSPSDKCSSGTKNNRAKLKREIELLKEMKRQKLSALKSSKDQKDSAPSHTIGCEATAADSTITDQHRQFSTISNSEKKTHHVTPRNNTRDQQILPKRDGGTKKNSVNTIDDHDDNITSPHPTRCLLPTITPLSTCTKPILVPASHKTCNVDKDKSETEDTKKDKVQQQIINDSSIDKALTSISLKKTDSDANATQHYTNSLQPNINGYTPGANAINSFIGADEPSRNDSKEHHFKPEETENLRRENFNSYNNNITTTYSIKDCPRMEATSMIEQSSSVILHQPFIPNYNYWSYNAYDANNTWYQNNYNYPYWAYPNYYYRYPQLDGFNYYQNNRQMIPFEQPRQQFMSAHVEMTDKKAEPPLRLASESTSYYDTQMPPLYRPYCYSSNSISSEHMIYNPYPNLPSGYHPQHNVNENYFSPHMSYAAYDRTHHNQGIMSNQKRISKKPSHKILNLSIKPVDPPSPWSKTHVIIPTLITISKTKNSSYGIDVKYETKYSYVTECIATTITSVPETNVPKSLESASPSISKSNSKQIKISEEESQTQVQHAPKVSRKRKTYGVILVTNPGRQSHALQEGDIILSIEGVPVGLTAKAEYFSQALTLLKNGDNGLEDICCCLEIARKVAAVPEKRCVRTDIAPAAPTNKEIKLLVNSDSAAVLKPFIVDETSREVISGEFSEEEMKILIRKIHQQLGEAAGNHSSFLWEQIALSFPQRDASAVHNRWLHAIRQCETEMHRKASLFWKKSWALEEKMASSLSDNATVSGDTKNKYRFLTDAARAQMRAYPRPASGCRCGSLSHQRVDNEDCILYRNNRLLPPLPLEISSSIQGPSSSIASSELKADKKRMKPTKSAVVAAGLDRIRRIQRELTADHKEAEFVNEMELRQIQNGVAVFAPSLTMMVISSIASILEEKQRKCCDGEEEDDLPLTKVAARITMPSVTLVEIALYISRTWGSVYVEPSSVQTAWRYKVHELITGKAYPRDGSVAQSFTMPRNSREQGSLPFENLRFILDDDEGMLQQLQGFQWAEDTNKQKDAVLPLEIPEQQASQLTKDTLMFTFIVSSWKTGLLDEVYSLHEAGILEKLGVGFRLKKNWMAHVDPLLLEEMHEKWGKDLGNRYYVYWSVRQQLLSSWERTAEGWVWNSQLQFSHEEMAVEYNSFVNEFDEWQDEMQGVGKFGV